MRKIVLLTVVCVIFLCGAAAANGVNWRAGYVEAFGIGLPAPQAISPAQARILAGRAAKAEAYANLLQLAGNIRLDGGNTIKTLTGADQAAYIRLEGVIKGAKVVDTQYFSDGSCRVLVRAPLYGEDGIQAAVKELSPAAEQLNGDIAQNALEQPALLKSMSDISVHLSWRHTGQDALPPELGLAYFYEDTRGNKAIFYSQESSVTPDHSAGVAAGKNVVISGAMIAKANRILLYVYSSRPGAADWAETEVIVSVKQAGYPALIITLHPQSNLARDVREIALLEKSPNNQLRIIPQPGSDDY